MAIKYIAKMHGIPVGKRTSGITHKTYSHAVVIWDADREPRVATWCSRADLAAGEARKYQRAGFRTMIVPAEIV